MYQFTKKYQDEDLANVNGKSITELVTYDTEPEWSQIKMVKIKVVDGGGIYPTIRAAGWKNSYGKDKLIIDRLKKIHGNLLDGNYWDIKTKDKTQYVNVPSYASYANYLSGKPDIPKEKKATDDAKKYKKAVNNDVNIIRKDKKKLRNKDFSGKGFVLNSSSTSDNTSYPIVFLVQQRLQEIYNYRKLNHFFRKLKSPEFDLEKGEEIKKKVEEKKKLSEADKAFINAQMKETVKTLTQLQKALKRDDFQMLDRINSSYGLKLSFVEGQLKYNDPTYVFLRDYWIKDLKYTTGTGDNKKTRSERVHNFYLNSKNSNLKTGIIASGKIKVDNKEAEIKKVYPGSLDRAAYIIASKSESKFDGINTWDGKKLSYGHIQFAGHSSLFKFLDHLKKNYPKTFETYFSKYGIDVTDSQVTVFDFHKTNKILKGEAAITHMSNHLEYSALFKASAWNTEVRKAQMEVAKSKFITEAEDHVLTIPTLTETNKEGKEVKKVLGGYPISKYKEEEAYLKAKKSNLITEDEITATAKEVTTKEETRAALYMMGIHRPKYVPSVMQLAVLRTITIKKITSLSDLKNKHQKELLKQMIKALKEVAKKHKEKSNEKVPLMEKLLGSMK